MAFLEMKFLNANFYPFLDVASSCSCSALNMSIKICFRKFHQQKTHLLYEISLIYSKMTIICHIYVNKIIFFVVLIWMLGWSIAGSFLTYKLGRGAFPPGPLYAPAPMSQYSPQSKSIFSKIQEKHWKKNEI
jgi:hypothetical protein